MTNAASPTYPVGVIAKLLLLTERRVQQLTAEGIIPKAERGRYELAPAVQGYIRFLQERHLGKEGDDGADATLASEKLRKMKADADMAIMERDEMAGSMISRKAISLTYSSKITAARARLLGIPKKLAPQLVDMPDPVEIETLIKAEVYAALRELGTTTQSQHDEGRDGSGGGGSVAGGTGAGGHGEGQPPLGRGGCPAVAPAAGVDGQPMG